ncbi:hypothetical protein R84B8_01867 [Treponema sp. R8-4-B8]
METKLILYHGSNCDFDEVDISKSKDKRNNQVSLHTSAALSHLKIIRKYTK